MSSRNPVSPTRNDLRAMTGDGVFFSVMVGAGETYLPAFVLTVGLGELTAGLITSIPMLAGALLQLASPAAVRACGSHRKWVVLCAAIQAASFLPLVGAALLGYLSTSVAFLIAAIYWGFGMATGPAWNTWAETIVPRPIRAGYFARRTRFTQAGVFSGFMLGGALLQVGSWYDFRMEAFAALFCVAACCRFISARFLASQSEPQPLPNDHRTVSAWELLSRFRRGGSERLLLYLISVQFSVYLAAPYFNPYMLGQLKFSYATYMSLVAISFVAKMMAMPALGRLAQRSGAQALLWFGGIGIVPLSGMWLISNSVPFLMGLQFAGGIVWASYELGMFLLFFETIPREERTSVLTLYNVANAMAMVLGSLVGGALFKYYGAQKEIYLTVFGLSSVARLCTLGILASLPIVKFRVTPISFRITAVRPSSGSIDRPILSSLPEDDHDTGGGHNGAPPPHAPRPELIRERDRTV